MTKKQKLLDTIKNNPKSVRFEDACKVAELLGFILRKGKGSHHFYSKNFDILNFQNRNGYIHSYQAMQLIEMINKYEQEIK